MSIVSILLEMCLKRVPSRIRMDVTDKGSISEVVKTIEEKEGKLDVLINK